MPAFNLDDYEPVESRLKRFWAENASATITTEVVHTYNNGGVIIKASIFIEDWHVSDGLAEEHPGTGPNQNCWVENCETSAIGRALANWKYSGDKRPSREEMEKAGRAEGNADRSTAPASPSVAAGGGSRATAQTSTSGTTKKAPNFQGMLFYRAKEQGLNSDTLAQERFGVRSSKGLTDEQAKTLLDELKATGEQSMDAAVETVQQGFGASEEPF